MTLGIVITTHETKSKTVTTLTKPAPFSGRLLPLLVYLIFRQ
ncbi:hypothetical protein SAMN04489731_112163 [Amycolatopsis regifaucium]|nr:hypothetical protein SAMN04489731_112163 [Amycolatopsis regifaucium]